MKKIGRRITEYEGRPQIKPVTNELLQRNRRVFVTLTHFPELSGFIVSQNKDVVLNKYFGVKTIEQAIKLNKLKLSELDQAYGEGAGITYLVPYAVHIQESCGLDAMTEIQQKSIAACLYDELFLLSLPELAVFVNRISRGKYGQFYNKLTPQLVGDAANQFKTERSKAIEKIDREIKGVSAPMGSKMVDLISLAPNTIKDSETGEVRESLFAKFKREAKEKPKGRLFGATDMKQLEIRKLNDIMAQLKNHLERKDLTDLKRVEFEESLSKVMDRLMELETE